jgi:hypothetical protein
LPAGFTVTGATSLLTAVFLVGSVRGVLLELVALLLEDAAMFVWLLLLLLLLLVVVFALGRSPMKPLQLEEPHWHGAFSLLIQSKL